MGAGNWGRGGGRRTEEFAAFQDGADAAQEVALGENLRDKPLASYGAQGFFHSWKGMHGEDENFCAPLGVLKLIGGRQPAGARHVEIEDDQVGMNSRVF
jgi:hypothetical protein